LVSFARRKLGDDMETNSWRSLMQEKELRFSKYGAMLLMMASNAG
jgi:hypothetical protein